MDDTTGEWVLYELRQSLRAIAAPGPIALNCVPEGAAKADELALDYGHWLEASADWVRAECTPEQRSTLEALSSSLDAMSGQEREELWTEQAVIESQEWMHVRALASSALKLLGWSGEPLDWKEYRTYRDTHERLPAAIAAELDLRPGARGAAPSESRVSGPKRTSLVGLGLVLGAGFGAALGAALGNVGVGVGVGAGLGLVLGVYLDMQDRQRAG